MIRLWLRPLFVLLALSLFSCNTAHDKDTHPSQTLVFGHRGTGTGVQGGFIENTLPGVKEALKYADGVEQDIQMSTDKTLWIYHDATFTHLCAGSYNLDSIGRCIPASPDSVIGAIRLCRDGVEGRIYKLEELFALYKSYPDKYISLDVKGYFGEGCVPGHNVSAAYLEDLGNAMYKLIVKYKLRDQVFVETGYTHLFEVLEALDSRIRCTLLGYSDINEKLARSIENKWEGISFNLSDSSATVANCRKVTAAGQVLQLWTIYNREGYREALRMHPTVVQVSSLDLLKTIHQNRKHRDG